MLIAMAARTRADCLGRRVGAVLVKDGRVISTGYNGTPFGMPNCSEGGCARCKHRSADPTMAKSGYDFCICVHAEQNALLTSARFGGTTLGAAIYSTTQPCFNCLKELTQAGISEVYYLHPWISPDEEPEMLSQYAQLRCRFSAFDQVGNPEQDSPDLFAPFLTRK